VTTQAEDTPKVEGQVPDTNTASKEPTDLEKLQARLASAEKELSKVRKEAADRRIKAKEAEDLTRKAEAEKALTTELAANYEKRLEELKAENAGLKPKADAWGDYLSAAAASLETKLEGLSPEDKDLVSQLDPIQALRLVERLEAAKAPPRAGVADHSTQTKNQEPIPDFGAARTVQELREMKEKNPAAWRAKLQRAQGPVNSLLARHRQKE